VTQKKLVTQQAPPFHTEGSPCDAEKASKQQAIVAMRTGIDSTEKFCGFMIACAHFCNMNLARLTINFLSKGESAILDLRAPDILALSLP
jgi:hypothetical protein